MNQGRALSLQARHLLAAGLGLVAFLGMTGLALDRAFTQTALSALQERMQSYALAYLGGTDLSRSGQLILPVTAPEPRFNTSGSGLYVAVRSDAFNWESPSAVGRPVPFDMPLVLGERRFEGPLGSDEGQVYRFGLGVAWTTETDEDFDFSIVVVESAQSVDREVAVFRRALWVYLGGAGALLLLVQILSSRWSLLPLRRVVRDLSKVERGELDRLGGTYPRELSLLTDNINELIEGEREHMARYRNTLGDLAHSLKTPLAVLRARIESGASGDVAGLHAEVRDQITRMDGIVAYQLARAATTGHQVFAAPIPIDPHAESLVQSLEKVYAAKNVLCEFNLDETARFYGELGDLLELLGNLLENAFKWARHRVMLSTQTLTVAPQRRSGLLIIVEDDGPGIPPEKVDLLLQRGVRGDERVQGHGIGLSIVQDIVRAYRGELAVERSDELGGARFVLRFSPAG